VAIQRNEIGVIPAGDGVFDGGVLKSFLEDISHEE
jgi:hypothetical protein